MNRSFLPVVALALASLFLVQCKKEDKNMVFDFNFYTSQSTAKMFLYVDDAPKGILPYFAQQPTCGSVSSDGVAPLRMQLRSGSYRIVGKDSLGTVLSSGTFHISANSMDNSGDIGGQMSAQQGHCVSLGLFY